LISTMLGKCLRISIVDIQVDRFMDDVGKCNALSGSYAAQRVIQ